MVVKSDRPSQSGAAGGAPPLRIMATAPASSSVKSAQAINPAATTTTPYGPVSRVSNVDAATTAGGGRIVNCRVTFLDDSYAIFRVPMRAKGGVLLKQVFKHLRVLEPEYFGLQYRDASEVYYWIDPEKPLNRHPGLAIPSTDAPMNFVFCVKFYSSDPAYLEDEFTRYLFVLQIRRDLATGQLACQDHTAALLAAYVVQAEEGDFNRDDYRDYTYLLKYRFHPRQDVDFLRMVMENHVELMGKNPAEADLNYLEIARRCEMYGIRLHDATDHESIALQLAVSHLGVNVFQTYQKINLFSWAKIRKLSFKRRRFLIKLHPETYQGYYKDTVEFIFDSRNACKSFWKKCIEHHVFFRGRTNDAQSMSRSRSRMFQYGSHFRFTGRTQRQVVECMKETLTKTRSASASATPQRASSHSNIAAQRQASAGGGTLPSSKSYTATLTATPLLPIAQMRRPLPQNRFNTTGGSRILHHHHHQQSHINRTTNGTATAQSRPPPADDVENVAAEPMKPSLPSTTAANAAAASQLVPTQVVAIPPTLDDETTRQPELRKSQTLPRAGRLPVGTADVAGAKLLAAKEAAAHNEPSPPVDTVGTVDNDDDVDKTPTQSRRRQSATNTATLPHIQQQPNAAELEDKKPAARRGSATPSLSSTVSRKSQKTDRPQQPPPPPLSTAFNGNGDDAQLPTPPAYDDQQRHDDDMYAVDTASNNTTPTTATTPVKQQQQKPKQHRIAVVAPILHEREFIEEYVMPMPSLSQLEQQSHVPHETSAGVTATSAHYGGAEAATEEEEEEEEDSLTGMNMAEEVPYVLYRRKVKWDKFLTYPPPPQPQQQQQQTLSPEEQLPTDGNQQQQHHRSAQQLASHQQQTADVALFTETALQQATATQPPYTTYTRYIGQPHAAAGGNHQQRNTLYSMEENNNNNNGASVITDVQIELQRLLPTSVPVLVTGVQRMQQQQLLSLQQKPSIGGSISGGSSEALIAAMPSTKLRVLDYVVVNRNRLPPVSMCYSYEDDSVSIDSLQRQLFDSIKRKQEARIRQSAPNTQQSTRASSRNNNNINAPATATDEPPAAGVAPPPPTATTASRRSSSKDEQHTGAQHGDWQRRERSRSTDSVESTGSTHSASSDSSSASEASYNTTSVDDGGDDDDDEHDADFENEPKSVRHRSVEKQVSSKKKKTRRNAPPPPLFVGKQAQRVHTAARTLKNQLPGKTNNGDDDLAYADESTTTATENNNANTSTQPTSSSTNGPTTTTTTGSSSDDQYYKRQRAAQQKRQLLSTSAQVSAIEPDDLVVPPPPPPPDHGGGSTLHHEGHGEGDQYLYDYEENPARAYLLEQQRRSRSLHDAPRSIALASGRSASPTPSEVAAAMMLLASQQHRRPSYDLAVTAGRMLANGATTITSVKQAAAAIEGAASKSRRIAGSRASAIGSHAAPPPSATAGESAVATSQHNKNEQQQPLKAISTTLPVYPSYERSVAQQQQLADSGVRRPSQETTKHQRPNGGSNSVSYTQSNLVAQSLDTVVPTLPPLPLLPPRPPGSGSTGSAHNDFSESELNAFVEMSYQDLQATVREYSLSSDRFTSSEGISTASSQSGASPDVHRSSAAFAAAAPYAPSFSLYQQRSSRNSTAPYRHVVDTNVPPSAAGGAVRKRNIVVDTKTNTTAVRQKVPPPAQQQQRGETSTTTTTTSSHAEDSTTTTTTTSSSNNDAAHTPSSSPTAAQSLPHDERSRHRSGRHHHHRTHQDHNDSQQQRETRAVVTTATSDDSLAAAAVPNLKLDTVLISVTEKTVIKQVDAAAEPTINRPVVSAESDEQHQFSPPPPPELFSGDGQQQQQQQQPPPSSYMDEWRAKMRELEQLTGVVASSSSSSSSATQSPGSSGEDYTTNSSTQSQDISPSTEHHQQTPSPGEHQQYTMPIMAPPAEFDNDNNNDEGEEEENGQMLPEMHGASGIRYGSTGGRLFELSSAPPRTLPQQHQAGAADESSEVHTSRL